MPNSSFPRKMRLLSSEDFDRVFKKPVRFGFAAKGILILVRPNELDHPRLGLIVPKKVLKRAVWRNNVKRIVRESFRLSQDSLPNVDLVFLAKQNIGDVSNRDLSSTIKWLLKKVSRQLRDQRS